VSRVQCLHNEVAGFTGGDLRSSYNNLDYYISLIWIFVQNSGTSEVRTLIVSKRKIMKNTILILIAICLIVAAIPCKAQDETKHIAIINQQ